MMSTDPGIIDLTELVGELAIPCEYDRLYGCGPAAATWLMVARCGCGVMAHRLVCEGCKDKTIQTEDGLCCPGCSMVWTPARRAFSRIERL